MVGTARPRGRSTARLVEARAVHVSAVSELVRSLVERRGLSEAEATAIVERVLRENPGQLPGRFRVPTQIRIRIEQLVNEAQLGTTPTA